MKALIQTDTERLAYIEAINRVPLDGKRTYTGEWKLYRKARTPSQNRYVHAIFGAIARETGNSLDTVKYTLKEMHAPKVPVVVGEIERMVPLGTSKMSTAQMSTFVDAIKAEAAINGIDVPDATSDNFASFCEHYGV